MSNPEQFAPVRPARRWPWVVAALLLLAALVVGGFVGLQYLGSRSAGEELQQAVAELDAADPHWRFEDIQADRRSPPAGRNSADVALAAERLLPGQFPSLEWSLPPTGLAGGEGVSPAQRFEAWPRNVRLDAALVRGLCRELTDCDAALAEGRRLAELPEGRYDVEFQIDFANGRMPHLDRVRALVWLLNADAAFRAQEGDMTGAWASLRAAVNAGRSIGDDPTMYSVLIRNGAVWSAVVCAERLLAQGETDPADLAAVQQLLEREERETVPDLITALRGERALMYRWMDAGEKGQVAVDDALGPQPDPWSPEAAGPTGVAFLRRSLAAYLRQFGTVIDAARGPLPEWGDKVKAVDERPADRTVLLSNVAVASVEKVMTSVRRKVALLRCASAALAAERFRKEKGRWPETLAELAPGHLATVPADPFDGAPLTMRRTEDGLVISSAGAERTGNPGAAGPKPPTPKGGELAFRLWDVSRRGQDAPLNEGGPP